MEPQTIFWLLAAIAFFWILKGAMRGGGKASKPKVREVVVSRKYPSFVAGLNHPGPDGLDRGAYLSELPIGAFLDLVPEPSNPHDDNAVALHHKGRHVGYVPAKHAWVGQSLDEGDDLVCIISKIEIDPARAGRACFVGLEIGVISDGE